MTTRERVELKRKAMMWDATVRWVLVPVLFPVVCWLQSWLWHCVKYQGGSQGLKKLWRIMTA